MSKPSQRLIAEIDSIFEQSDPYAVISEVLDDPDLTNMMEGYADSWRVTATGETYVADPCLPRVILDLWPKTVMVPSENAGESARETHSRLTPEDFVPAYALQVSGGIEIKADGSHALALEIKERATDIALRLLSSPDPAIEKYELRDTNGYLLDYFDELETLFILASLANEKPFDFEEITPLAQIAVMLDIIGRKYGASAEEFRTAAPLIPDQNERLANVSGAVVHAHHHVFGNSVVTTAIERLVKFKELDTDVLYRMWTGQFVSPESEEAPAQQSMFIKTLASPAAYEVDNIAAVEPTLRGTTYKLPVDLNTLDTFSDTVQQVIASVVEKTTPEPR